LSLKPTHGVIPVLVAGIHLTSCSGACGWLDTGDKPRYDNWLQGPATKRSGGLGEIMDLFGRLLRLMALGGGVVLMLLMGYTVLDVVLRASSSIGMDCRPFIGMDCRPFSGSLEVTEFAMAVIVFLGIAYCGFTGGHVAVDILERPLQSPRLRFVPVLLTLAGAVLFAAIAWLTAAEALTSMHRVSNMVRWPHWPFQLTVALGSAMYALVLLFQTIDILRGKPHGSADDAR